MEETKTHSRSDSDPSNSVDQEKAVSSAVDAQILDMPADPDAHLSETEKAAADRKLVWKLDLILIPWLCLLYLLAFLDRTNIGNAKVAGLATDLKIKTSLSYNDTLTIFFVSYAVFEPITNILLKRLRPSIFIPIIMVLWGACMLGMGFVKSWKGLMTARFFLGMCEAGLFPGVNYYLSCWYKRSEFGIRSAIFFSAAAVSGSFGGLLAAAIEKMDGLGGLRGWAWIFVLEGLATIVCGFLSFWLVHDFPDEAKFLSDDDRARVIRRLKLDQQSSAEHEEFKMTYFWRSIRDWKMWLGMVIYMGTDMPLYAFSLFLPTIIAGLGKWTTTQTQLLTVPPYAVAAIFTVLIGYIADRTRQRGLCNIVMSAIGVIGFALLRSPNVGNHAKYAACFLGALGIYPTIANTISWSANNVEGSYKRGVVLGFVIGWGNLNGIVSSNIFFQSPKFHIGYDIILVYMSCFLFFGSIVNTLLLRQENAARKAGKRDHWVEGLSQPEIEALGDKRPDFLYTV